jgi:hypothetical protein
MFADTVGFKGDRFSIATSIDKSLQFIKSAYWPQNLSKDYAATGQNMVAMILVEDSLIGEPTVPSAAWLVLPAKSA